MTIERGAPAVGRRVRDVYDATVPALVHPDWATSFPWLIQGTTTRGAPDREFDLRLSSAGAVRSVVRMRWGHLMAATAMGAAVYARQVHEAEVRFHDAARPGLHVVDSCDGHATDHTDILLTVTAADCVPVFIVDPEARAVAVVHAGWRGVVAGVLERGLDVLADRVGTRAVDVHLHLGPAICGDCYEVGPEVFEALQRPVPARPGTVDLRSVLADRAIAKGVEPSRLTISGHCTRCTGSGLFSHRGGDRARQVGYVGIRP